MSHFTVLVIGDDYEAQLAPYHEFECTGTDDQYVQEIDKTEEARAEFLKRKSTRYRTPSGELISAYDEQGNFKMEFLRDPTPEEEKMHGMGSGYTNGLYFTSGNWNDGKGYRHRIKIIPDGYEEVEVPTSEVETFAEFIEGWYGHKKVRSGETPDLTGPHKYGYTVVDEHGDVIKTVARTNENKKWDWYVVGGRWNGFFKLKVSGNGIVGKPGINEMNPGYKAPGPDRADTCLKGDIDIEGMRNEAGAKAAEKYDLYSATIAGLPKIVSWKDMREKHAGNIDAARAEYHAQPALKALRERDETKWFNADDFAETREIHIKNERKRALSPFAVVKDSKWYEKGEMGWWACVANEKEQQQWNAEVNSLIDGLPDNTLLTLIDCHI